MTKREKLIDLLEEMGDIDLIMLHNDYCQQCNYYDDEIFTIDMFDDIFNDVDPFDVALKIYYGDFNPSYEYFKFNGYGNIQSICKWELDRFIDIDDIVNYILDNNFSFENNDILYILDDIEGDSEE